MKTIAVIPIAGREDILKITIPKLIKQVYKVILVGNISGKESSIEFWNEHLNGSDYFFCDNSVKRGAKWQFAIDKAREYSPDAIAIMSSGGVVRDNYFDVELTDVTGSKGLYYFDYQPRAQRMIFWPGYHGARQTEPVGLGRIISSKVLDRCDWQIYPKDVQSGLDGRSMDVFKKYDAEIVLREYDHPLRISSYKYVQTNSFDHMSKNNSRIINNPEEILTQYGL